MRCIEIKTCRECPHRNHRGGFAVIGYVPYCKLSDEDLPHSMLLERSKIVASPTYEIPNSCPLPKLEKETL